MDVRWAMTDKPALIVRVVLNKEKHDKFNQMHVYINCSTIKKHIILYGFPNNDKEETVRVSSASLLYF